MQNIQSWDPTNAEGQQTTDSHFCKNNVIETEYLPPLVALSRLIEIFVYLIGHIPRKMKFKFIT